MFMEPTPTPYDLRWRMFGIRVRVHPSFWLLSLLIGWHLTQFGFHILLLWVACMFVSILVHELGHVVAGRLFGSSLHVILYSFGGLAVGNAGRLRPWQSVAVSLAGPAAGLALLGFVLLLDTYWFWPHMTIARTSEPFIAVIKFLVFMNFFWSLLNLIPVYPLDGGQVLREICMAVSPQRGFRRALGISFVVGGLVAVYSLLVLSRGREDATLFWPRLQDSPGERFSFGIDPLFMAILFGLLAVQCFLTMQAAGREDRPWNED